MCEVGCYLSHLITLQKIIENDDIYENDNATGIIVKRRIDVTNFYS